MSWTPNPNIKRIIKQALASGNNDAIEVLKDKVVSNAPKDTGKMANSVETESSEGGLTQTVEVNVPYAQAVEFGTSKQAANPFVRTAIKSSKEKMLRQFRGKL